MSPSAAELFDKLLTYESVSQQKTPTIISRAYLRSSGTNAPDWLRLCSYTREQLSNPSTHADATRLVRMIVDGRFQIAGDNAVKDRMIRAMVLASAHRTETEESFTPRNLEEHLLLTATSQTKRWQENAGFGDASAVHPKPTDTSKQAVLVTDLPPI